MNARNIAFSLAASLIFLGPLLAGLTGAGPVVLPIFGAIFLLWVTASRPAVWAQATASGTPIGLAAYLSGITILQILLIVLCYAIGLGLVTLMGEVVPLPHWVAPLVSLAAVPLGRLIRSPQADLEESLEFLDAVEAEIDADGGKGPKA